MCQRTGSRPVICQPGNLGYGAGAGARLPLTVRRLLLRRLWPDRGHDARVRAGHPLQAARQLRSPFPLGETLSGAASVEERLLSEAFCEGNLTLFSATSSPMHEWGVVKPVWHQAWSRAL